MSTSLHLWHSYLMPQSLSLEKALYNSFFSTLFSGMSFPSTSHILSFPDCCHWAYVIHLLCLFIPPHERDYSLSLCWTSLNMILSRTIHMVANCMTSFPVLNGMHSFSCNVHFPLSYIGNIIRVKLIGIIKNNFGQKKWSFPLVENNPTTNEENLHFLIIMHLRTLEQPCL